MPINYKFNRDISTTFAPAIYYWTDGSTAPIGTNTGAPRFTAPNGASYLHIIAAPGDVSFKLANQKAKFYWDFNYNTSGDDRIQRAYGINGSNNVDLSDNLAWLVGFQVGDNKKKGDWLVGVDFRQIGLGSVDPNLSDSDWGNGFLNQQGVKVRVGYNFTDFLSGNITYYNTWNYKENLTSASSATGAATLATLNSTDRLQFDLNWKF